MTTKKVRFQLADLEKPARILIDRWGIPHIKAETKADLFFAQGFNIARDRLWQIDLWRKRGLGLLAADFGPGYLAQDQAARTARDSMEKVAIIDDAEELGGLCILRGCMPSKTLIYSTEVLHLARHGEKFGLKNPTSTWTYTINDQYKEYLQNPSSWAAGTVLAYWMRKMLRPVFGWQKF